jgi:hypothetical protein
VRFPRFCWALQIAPIIKVESVFLDWDPPDVHLLWPRRANLIRDQSVTATDKPCGRMVHPPVHVSLFERPILCRSHLSVQRPVIKPCQVNSDICPTVLTNSVELSATREATSCVTTHSFPAIYWTRRFITTFTRALHLSLSWARPIQSTPSYTMSTRSISLLSTHLS